MAPTTSFLLTLVVGAALLVVTHGQTMPLGCLYYSGLYECDYSNLTTGSLLPLASSGFVPVAQRVRMTNLPASLTTAVFATDFANISTASYDTNYPASLELECTGGSTLTMAAGFLANMGHIEDFKISNCVIGTVPANVFSELGTLDRFTIENGTITTIDAGMLTGVTIVRNTSVSPHYPKQNGEFAIINTAVSSIPSTLFSSQTGLHTIVLRNLGLTTLDAALFESTNTARHLDLSYNDFSTLPNNVWNDLPNLGEVKLYGTEVTCSCTDLWFIEWAKTNHKSLLGDIVCVNTTDYYNKLAWEYYSTECVKEPATCSEGIALLGACMTPIDLTGYSIGFIAFVLGWVVLGLAINTKKKMNPTKGNAAKPKPGAKKKPPAKKGAPKSGWA